MLSRPRTSSTLWMISEAALATLICASSAAAQTTMLDYSFADSGTVRTAINGGGGFGDRAFSVAIQNDGKIVAAGYSTANGPHSEFAVARYDSNGTLDSTFGDHGTVRNAIPAGNGSDDEGRSVALQPDGKILVAGFSFISSGAGVDFAVARYNSNGALDASFGGGTGTATAALGTSGLSEAYSLALQKDGKIVLGGYCESPPLTITFALARFTADGSLDAAFGTGGTVRTPIPGARAYAYSVAIQSDGKIVLAGNNGSQFLVVRYDTNGVVDSTFGTNGIAAITIAGSNGHNDNAYSVAIQSDGRIIIAGRGADTLSRFGFAVARLETDGTPDNSFGAGGSEFVFINGGGLANCFAQAGSIQPDGKIVLVGSSYDTLGHGEFALARLDTDGTADNSFGTNGTTRNPIIGGTGFADQGFALAVQPDGRIVAAGSSMDQSNNTLFAVARYLPHNGPVNVTQEKTDIPGRYSLLQNYPNPFNPTTVISYQLPVASYVELKVYDILGREVAALVNERENAGVHKVKFDAAGLSSGVYFYRIRSGEFVQAKRLVVLR